jgi:hypothetical protein
MPELRNCLCYFWSNWFVEAWCVTYNNKCGTCRLDLDRFADIKGALRLYALRFGGLSRFGSGYISIRVQLDLLDSGCWSRQWQKLCQGYSLPVESVVCCLMLGINFSGKVVRCVASSTVPRTKLAVHSASGPVQYATRWETRAVEDETYRYMWFGLLKMLIQMSKRVQIWVVSQIRVLLLKGLSRDWINLDSSILDAGL